MNLLSPRSWLCTLGRAGLCSAVPPWNSSSIPARSRSSRAAENPNQAPSIPSVTAAAPSQLQCSFALWEQQFIPRSLLRSFSALLNETPEHPRQGWPWWAGMEIPHEGGTELIISIIYGRDIPKLWLYHDAISVRDVFFLRLDSRERKILCFLDYLSPALKT